jgi:hypothetical protein
MASDGGEMNHIPLQPQSVPMPAETHHDEMHGPVEETHLSPHPSVSRPLMLRPVASTSAQAPDPAAGMSRPQWQTATNPGNRNNSTPTLAPANRTTSTPGLIGPIGYDVQK